jgi:hypothetical protein
VRLGLPGKDPQGIPEEFSYKLLHGHPAMIDFQPFIMIFDAVSFGFPLTSGIFQYLPAMMTSQVWKHHQKHLDDPPTSTMLASTKRSSKHQGNHCLIHTQQQQQKTTPNCHTESSLEIQ